MNQSILKELLSYDPATGIFVWIKSSRPGFSGRRAGGIDSRGYIIIRVHGKEYKASRLAFLYMTGEWPKDFVDHINRVRSDDRWANLRNATRSQNAINAFRSDNVSGVAGVYRHREKWCAQITVDGKPKYLGIFSSVEEAAKVVEVLRRQHYGEFAGAGV